MITKTKILTIAFILIISKLFSQNIHEKIIFKSANPFSFKDIIKNLEDQVPQDVYGVLTLPSDVQGKIPLVIGVAGSKDWASHHRE